MKKLLIIFVIVFVVSIAMLINVSLILYVSKLVYWFKSENWQGVAMLVALPLCFVSGAGSLLIVAIMDLQGRSNLRDLPDKPKNSQPKNKA